MTRIRSRQYIFKQTMGDLGWGELLLQNSLHENAYNSLLGNLTLIRPLKKITFFIGLYQGGYRSIMEQE
jgi:hypothetical protein